MKITFPGFPNRTGWFIVSRTVLRQIGSRFDSHKKKNTDAPRVLPHYKWNHRPHQWNC